MSAASRTYSWLLYALPGAVQRYSDESPEDIFLESTLNDCAYPLRWVLIPDLLSRRPRIYA
jgi:hypothetical protein